METTCSNTAELEDYIYRNIIFILCQTFFFLADEYSWDSVEKRNVWENSFDSEYIQPILEVS